MGPHVVALVLTDQMPIFELAVPCEVFGVDRADLVDPWYQLRLCAAKPGTVRATADARIQARHGPSAIINADTVLVAAPGPEALVNPPAVLLDALRKAHVRGARIASICSGAYLLAAAGLLDGRRATLHWMEADDFASRWPHVMVDPAVLYVDDGDILTSAGSGAAIDLCLHLVRRDHGAAVANALERRMVVPPHREGGLAQCMQMPAKPPCGNELGPVLDWALRRLEQPLAVAEMARHARMSPRTFARRFQERMGVAPLQWLILQRVRRAQELLETTDAPIEWVAHHAGFGSAANFREHFNRATRVQPHIYRARFRQSPIERRLPS